MSKKYKFIKGKNEKEKEAVADASVGDAVTDQPAATPQAFQKPSSKAMQEKLYKK